MEVLYIIGMPVGLALLGIIIIFMSFESFADAKVAKAKQSPAQSKTKFIVGFAGSISLGIFLLLSAAEVAFGDYKFFGYNPQGHRFVLETAQWYVSRYLMGICAVVIILTQIIRLITFILKKIKKAKADEKDNTSINPPA